MRLRALGRSRNQNFPSHVTRLDQSVSVGCLFEGKVARDFDAQSSGHHELTNTLQSRAVWRHPEKAGSETSFPGKRSVRFGFASQQTDDQPAGAEVVQKLRIIAAA